MIAVILFIRALTDELKKTRRRFKRAHPSTPSVNPFHRSEYLVRPLLPKHFLC
jgi:hypothetical protein